jgi:HTH-type transcriptional regulator / antitoxin HigA
MITGSNLSYAELLQLFPPRTIITEQQFWETQHVIDDLLDKGDLTPDEEEYLNLLGTLIYVYEEENVPIPELRGVELIKACLSERNLRQKDLVPIFKTESIVSAVLNGRRKLTVEHIKKL